MNDPKLYLALVLGLGAVAQLVAWKLRVPSILFLLAFGFAIGEFLGLRIDQFIESRDVLLAVVSFSVAVILFEGGLTLKFSELKEAGTPVIRLCSLGVLIAWVGGALAGKLIFGLNWWVALLIGAILVVTGPTVVSPILRAVQPTRKVSSMVKWEGIVVDPIGAILAVLVFQVAIAVDAQEAALTVVLSLGKTILVGVILALALAKLVEFALRHHWVPDFLHSPFLLAVLGVAFTGSNYVQYESGLLTVTVLGMALANQKSVPVKHILEFKENLRVLLISTLFIVLSGRVSGAELMKVMLPAALFLLALVLVIRPASVFGGLWRTNATIKERWFLSALAPRGIVAAAVTSIFALKLEGAAASGYLDASVADQAAQLEAIIFLVIVGTVTIYGLSAVPLARLLGVSSSSAPGILFAGADKWARLLAEALRKDGVEVLMLDTNFSNVTKAKMLGINAVRANILSQYAEDEIDFTGLGIFIAGTPNDEVNSLAVKELSSEFSSANVWQLAPQDDDAPRSTAVSHHMRGRILFTGRPRHERLERLVAEGWQVKSTQITQQFKLENFYGMYGSEAILLCFRGGDGKTRPVGEELRSVPIGSTIYSLVPAGGERAQAAQG